MAFEIRLDKKEVTNPEANRIYLKDITGSVGEITYKETTPGVYESVINSTGYGAPNPDREDLANLIVGRLKSTKGDVYVDFVPYNPVTVAEYVAKINVDGWYVFNVISLPIVSSGVEGESYYNPLDGKVYKVIGGVGSEVELKSLLTSGYNVEQVEQFYVGNSKLTKSKYNIKISDLHKSNINCCNDKQIHVLQNSYNELRGMLQAAIYEYCRGNKFNAQENIEYINSQIDELL